MLHVSQVRTVITLFLLSACLTAPHPALSQPPEPVAHYDFDEGSGGVLHDSSGHGNDGEIHGARFVRSGRGYALAFDGLADYVDCGNRPSLDFHASSTVEAWVYPASPPSGEVGVVGKGYTSYLLSLYNNGFCYWYVSAGGNNTRAPLLIGSWHHMVGTFDGKTLKLYLDGKLAGEMASQASIVASGGNLLLGRGPEGEAGFFHGLLDEISIYDRALSEAEVQARFESGLKTLGLSTPFAPAPAVAEARKGSLTVHAATDGQVQIDTGHGTYLLESQFSYPGDFIRKGSTVPQVHRFDLDGHEVPAQVTPRREGDGWLVPVRIHDWAEIVVIE